MMKCPLCQNHELTQEFYEKKINFRCRTCGGRLVTVSGLRSLCADRAFADELWRRAKYCWSSEGAICGSCGKPMRQVDVPLAGTTIELDVCCPCQLVWFDPSELEQIPLPEPEEAGQLPQKAREALALYQVEKIASQHNRTFGDSYHDGPDGAWDYFVAFLGFPVEESATKSIRAPFITWTIATLCAVIFAFTFTNLREVIDNWGFIPAQWSRHGGLTVITSMFLHGGLLHLVGNLYFLLVFGDNVEDEFGRLKYAVLLIASGLSAVLLHAIFDFRPNIPCVGASGFISGVIACYAICFPRAKLSFMLLPRSLFFLLFLRRNWVTIPAWAAFGIWIFFQILMAAAARNAAGGTAYMAHLGGALPGVIFALYHRFGWKEKNQPASKSLDDLRNCK